MDIIEIYIYGNAELGQLDHSKKIGRANQICTMQTSNVSQESVEALASNFFKKKKTCKYMFV